MSVAEHLGLNDPDTNELIHQARRRWPGWSRRDPRLGVVSDPLQLPAWTLAADRAEADDVLHALATLAADDTGSTTVSGDDTFHGRPGDGHTAAGPASRARSRVSHRRPQGWPGREGPRRRRDGELAAAMTLCWTLLPAAASTAHQLRGLSPTIDEAVASQLWVEVRTFPWRRLRKVAANIRANTRAGVLRQCGDRARGRAGDRTWSQTWPYDPTAPAWAALVDPRRDPRTDPRADLGPDAGDRAPSEELMDVLEWACRQDVITGEERSLLLSLVHAAEGTVVTRTRRGGGGLLANELSAQVAQGLGVSPVTVRRRARRSMLALAEACRHGRYDACA